jgi:hypothetical protein
MAEQRQAKAAPETPVNVPADYNKVFTMQCYTVRGRRDNSGVKSCPHSCEVAVCPRRS